MAGSFQYVVIAQAGISPQLLIGFGDYGASITLSTDTRVTGIIVGFDPVLGFLQLG